MGLDMYLKAQLYISGWNHSPEAERKKLPATLAAAGLPVGIVTEDSPHAELSVCVAYWRKANAIHRWFVENVQDGKDECQEDYVSREQLVALRDVCARVLKVARVSEGQPVHSGTTWRAGQEEPEQHFEIGRAILNGTEVAEILPTQAGFFFGSTDYDEWYLNDVENTIAQLDHVLLVVPDKCDFYYRASW